MKGAGYLFVQPKLVEGAAEAKRTLLNRDRAR
jgi:hypothetical protein